MVLNKLGLVDDLNGKSQFLIQIGVPAQKIVGGDENAALPFQPSKRLFPLRLASRSQKNRKARSKPLQLALQL